MREKQRKRKKARAQTHQAEQAERLIAAMVEVAKLQPKSKKQQLKLMEERGYVPNGKPGGWRPIVRVERKSTIDKEV